MSSWSGVILDGMPVFETQNYYHPWYFHPSERAIEGTPPDKLDHEAQIISNESNFKYLFKMQTAVLRRRLDLAGHNYASLEQEFKVQHKQLVEDLDTMLQLGSDDAERYYEEVKKSTLKKWVKCLQFIKNNKDDELETIEKKIEIADVELQCLLRFMMSINVYFSAYPTSGDFHFPCTSVEGYAVALLEITPDDTECILDITELVRAGWTDDFSDLIELEKEHTLFYENFSESLIDIHGLMAAAPENRTLAKLLYAAVITAMETYLSDTFKKQVLNRPAIKKRFVKSHDFFKRDKFSLSEIYERSASLNELIVSEIDTISFHNLNRVLALYKAVLATNFPTELLADLKHAIDNRHDIVHRNGKDTTDNSLVVEMTNVSDLINLVDEVVKFIDEQIKDGLLDSNFDLGGHQDFEV